MKNIFTFIVLCFVALNISAQVPEGIIYQAEARDNYGKLIASESLDVKIAILEDNSTGLLVWEGLYNVTTNKYGMFVLIIGDGESTSTYAFDAIDWSNHSHFLNVKVKRESDPDWVNMGTSQFLSVPYALHAKTAESLVAKEVLSVKKAQTDGVPSQNWSLFGNSKSDPETDKLGTTDVADLVLITDNEERMRILANGDIEMKNSLEVGKDLTVKRNVYLNTEGGETINNGPLTVANQSKTTLTGDLLVNGETRLDSTVLMNVKNGQTINYGNFTVENTSNTKLTGELTVNGRSQFDSDMNVDAIATINKIIVDTTENYSTPRDPNSIVDVRGLLVADSIVIAGGLDIGGNLKVHGDSVIIDHHLNVGGRTQLGDQVTIDAPINGADSDYGAYPLRVQGGDQGIAIKVNGSRSNSNNYVTFWDENGIQGRIEGETTTDLLTNPEYIFDNVMFAVDIEITSGQLAIAIAEEVQAIAEGVSYAASENICGGVGAVVCPPPPAQAITVATNIAVKTANLVLAGASEAKAVAEPVAYNTFKHTQIGVTYQSGAGDYAEWLPKANPSEKLFPGEVVGVTQGLIDHNTSVAEKVLVISSKPIVLGNTPEEGKEGEYEKVAFMGQVPVKVLGDVNKGDYIVPSGNNDGYGKAVSPDKLTISDCKNIVGIAWSSSGTSQLGYVNVAVGLNSNDLAQFTLQLQETINKQATEIEDLKNKFEQMDEVLSRLDSDYEILRKGTKSARANQLTTDNTEPSITYYRMSKSQIEEGVVVARERLKEQGVDVDNHPFFKKLADDESYKQAYVERVEKAFDNEIARKTKENAANGIETIVKDL